MVIDRRQWVYGVAGGLALAWTATGVADTLSFVPIKDNTLIQSTTGGRSNALGDGIYSGRIGAIGGGQRMRAVLAFDLSAIPAGSTINSVSLALFLISSNTGNQTNTLHRLLKDWGEGTSAGNGGLGSDATIGDATWLHTFYPDVKTMWTNAGGDFVAAASATLVIADLETTYIWSSAAMAADVQYWIDSPASNFGWLIYGNEAVQQTAKKFASKDHFKKVLWPRLEVDFTPPASVCVADIAPAKWPDGEVNVSDLLAVIDGWGECALPCPPHCNADINDDCSVNVSDLLAVINAWGPCP